MSQEVTFEVTGTEPPDGRYRACRAAFEAWRELGLPDMRAPRGGRAHVMHCDDEGLTWSKPQTLVDTECDDRHPTILELDDGTLMCTFFNYRFPRVTYARYMLSHDGGRTWPMAGIQQTPTVLEQR